MIRPYIIKTIVGIDIIGAFSGVIDDVFPFEVFLFVYQFLETILNVLNEVYL